MLQHLASLTYNLAENVVDERPIRANHSFFFNDLNQSLFLPSHFGQGRSQGLSQPVCQIYMMMFCCQATFFREEIYYY
jgi:hypothetical protein